MPISNEGFDLPGRVRSCDFASCVPSVRTGFYLCHSQLAFPPIAQILDPDHLTLGTFRFEPTVVVLDEIREVLKHLCHHRAVWEAHQCLMRVRRAVLAV